VDCKSLEKDWMEDFAIFFLKKLQAGGLSDSYKNFIVVTHTLTSSLCQGQQLSAIVLFRGMLMPLRAHRVGSNGDLRSGFCSLARTSPRHAYLRPR
jgi:hypothetical protein